MPAARKLAGTSRDRSKDGSARHAMCDVRKSLNLSNLRRSIRAVFFVRAELRRGRGLYVSVRQTSFIRSVDNSHPCPRTGPMADVRPLLRRLRLPNPVFSSLVSQVVRRTVERRLDFARQNRLSRKEPPLGEISLPRGRLLVATSATTAVLIS